MEGMLAILEGNSGWINSGIEVRKLLEPQCYANLKAPDQPATVTMNQTDTGQNKKFTTTRYQIRGGTTRTQTSRKRAIKSGGRSGQAVYPFYAVVVYKVSKDKLHRYWDGIKGNTRRRG